MTVLNLLKQRLEDTSIALELAKKKKLSCLTKLSSEVHKLQLQIDKLEQEIN